MNLDVATVVGARPQFVKCGLVSRALRGAGLHERLIHTGQHYDDAMSGIFFRELNIPEPDMNLEIGSGSHAEQTAAALVRLEAAFVDQRPRLVLVYGDTNSTLAGALAAAKLRVPVAHVEAGLRSYNRSMPEEINRVATDHWSDLLFCHNNITRDRLLAEQVRGRIEVVGDVMRQMVATCGILAAKVARPEIPFERYLVLTVHRPMNADADALSRILKWCEQAPLPLVFPAHPRVREIVESKLRRSPALRERMCLLSPLSYLEMMALIQHSQLVLTDSGGLQKEAFFLGVPCVTLRGETEWIETVDAGWNRLTGDQPGVESLNSAVRPMLTARPSQSAEEHETLIAAAFGPPDPVQRIVCTICEYLEIRASH